jgi:salicylate hydroxylase
MSRSGVDRDNSRNGLTGELLKRSGPSNLPLQFHPQRVRRTRLQSALKAQVPEGTIKLQKRLSSLENLDDETVRLTFDDGTETTVDLVVGGDGIRSVRYPFLTSPLGC